MNTTSPLLLVYLQFQVWDFLQVDVRQLNFAFQFRIRFWNCWCVVYIYIIFNRILQLSEILSMHRCVNESERLRLKEYAEIRSLQNTEIQVLIPQVVQVNQQLNDSQNGQQTVAHNQYNVVKQDVQPVM
ncbi:Hypothetical_protein [Hexamita inflata]|uniref:Hypothetical_protein n=1 Tax=Hexamita inflata TaxID=28002 RepID=A0ABP1GEA8_9EUKA